MFVLFVVPLAYLITHLELFQDMLQHGGGARGMKPPSEQEASCAVSLIRLALVVVYWGAALWAFSRA